MDELDEVQRRMDARIEEAIHSGKLRLLVDPVTGRRYGYQATSIRPRVVPQQREGLGA